jgi:hypothetical protein
MWGFGSAQAAAPVNTFGGGGGGGFMQPAAPTFGAGAGSVASTFGMPATTFGAPQTASFQPLGGQTQVKAGPQSADIEIPKSPTDGISALGSIIISYKNNEKREKNNKKKILISFYSS